MRSLRVSENVECQLKNRNAKMRIIRTIGLTAILVYCMHFCYASFWSTPAPSRADFEAVYSKTTANIDKEGNIIIKDANGKTLTLQVVLWPKAPAIPEGYQLHTHFDKIKVDSSRKPSVSLCLGEELILHGGRLDEAAGFQRLSDGITALINWSITAVDTKTQTLVREVTTGGYEFHCDQAKGLYYLTDIAIRQLGQADIEEAARSAERNEIMITGWERPVTSFERAHLWQFLITNYTDINKLASTYLMNVKAQMEKGSSAAKAEQGELLSQKMLKDQKTSETENIEKERIDSLFPRAAQ